MGYRTNTPYWGQKKAKLNVLGPIGYQFDPKVNIAPVEHQVQSC
jgi:hypothetical protein